MATVESIDKVTLLPEALLVIPLPPRTPSVSDPKSIVILDDPSVTSKFCEAN